MLSRLRVSRRGGALRIRIVRPPSGGGRRPLPPAGETSAATAVRNPPSKPRSP